MAKPAAASGGPKKRGAPPSGKGGSPKKQKLNNGAGQARKPSGGAPAKGGFKGKKVPGGKPSGGKRPQGDAPSKPRESKEPAAKLTKHERKEKVRAKLATVKKNFSLIQDAVKLWEVLRPTSTADEDKAKIVDQIMAKVDGKLLELAQHHTASRIIQFCAKYGTPAQRKQIMEQVRANLVELSKSKYGHHLAQKLINISKKEDVPGLVRYFKGHMAELLRHPYGADVLTDLYDVAPAALRNAMCAEFYGREYVLFDGVSGQGSALTSLSQLLATVPGPKRVSILQHMTKACVPIMEKAILHPPMVHRLLRDLLECAPGSVVEDAVDTLSATGASVLKMVHTHEGAAVGCMLLAYGSARDRKRLIKAMKGYVKEMATNEWGHVVLCTALSVVDDTSLLNKVIVSELKAMIGEAVQDNHASRVLLQLLAPYNRRYLPPAALAMMQPPARMVTGSGKRVTDLEGDEDEVGFGAGGDDKAGFDVDMDDEDGEEGDDLFAPKAKKAKGSGEDGSGAGKVGSKGKAKGKKGAEAESDEDEEADAGEGGERQLGLSKKDPLQRRKELLSTGGASSLAVTLAAAVAEAAGSLLRGPHTCDLVVEVARGGDDGLLLELAPEGVAAVHEALVADACGEAAAAEAEEEDEEGPAGPAPQAEEVFTHYYGSRALRRLILASEEEGKGGEGARAFVEALWPKALAGQCKRRVGSHADKVLAALVMCGSAQVKAAASKELAPLVKPASLEAWAAKFTAAPGAKGGGHQQGKAAEAAAPAKTPAGKAAGKTPAKAAAQVPAAKQQAAGKTPGKAAEAAPAVTPQTAPKPKPGAQSAVKSAAKAPASSQPKSAKKRPAPA